jgi:hypothetical protein
MVHLTDGKGNVLPGVKIDKVRLLVLYDYVEKSGVKGDTGSDVRHEQPALLTEPAAIP